MTRFASFSGQNPGFARPVLVFLVTLLSPLAAMGQNLLSNSNFNGSQAPWLAFGSVLPNPVASGAANWTNAANNDNIMNGSGSMETVLSGSLPLAANAAFGVRQCVQLPGAPLVVTDANYAARFLAPISNPEDGLANATVELRFFSDSNCVDFIPGAGGSQGYDLLSDTLSDTEWYEIGHSSFSPSATSITASSAEVRAFVRTVATTGSSYQVYFDRIILSLNGDVAVELQSFAIK